MTGKRPAYVRWLPESLIRGRWSGLSTRLWRDVEREHTDAFAEGRIWRGDGSWREVSWCS